MARTLMILLLAFVMFLSGCVGTRSAPIDDGAKLVAKDGPAKADKVHCGGGGAAAVLIFYGIVILVTVVIDVLLLPATGPCGDPFCCTQAVVLCCR